MSDGQLYLYIAVWSQIASSIVFIGALVFVWFRWILPLVMAAQARSNRQIAEAERHRDEMKGALEAVHAEVETARHDVRLIEERASARADHERQLLIDEARAEGERTLADASRELQRALAAARRLELCVRLSLRFLDGALRLLRVLHRDLRRFIRALGTRVRDAVLGLTPSRGTNAFSLGAQAARLAVISSVIRDEALDVLAPLCDRAPHRPQKDDVEHREEDRKVDQLNDQRPVDRKKRHVGLTSPTP